MKKLFTACLAFVLFTGLYGQDKITVEQIWRDYAYTAKSVPGFNFMNDGKHYTRIVDNVIIKYDLTTGAAVENILIGDNLKDQNGFNGKIGAYTFSPNESYIMIESDRESIYRRSSKANFYLFNRTNQELTSIYSDDKIMYATLSPDAKKVAYVYENNIYIKDLESNKVNQVTSDGKYNKIING